MKEKITPYKRIIIIISVLIMIFNAISFIRPFSDFYADNIYGVIADFLGKIMDIFPFAVGEILMYLFAFLFVLTIFLSALLLLLHRRESYKRFLKKYIKAMLLIFLSVLLIYTLNWVIPFRASILSDKRLGRNAYVRAYSIEELETLRSYIVDKLNETSEAVERDENGRLIYRDDETVRKELALSMKALGDEYPRLKGYYPDIKKAFCSSVLEWMNIGGYNYPYTMEATYNEYVTRLYFPSLYAHEISHHHGYYQENEANFLSYLGCINSDDAFIRYSGYIDAFFYVDDAYITSLIEAIGKEKALEIYKNQPMPKKQIYTDEAEASIEASSRYEENSHPMEKLKDKAEKAADKGWEMQEKMVYGNYYEDVVGLLLYYYDGKLY
ncbi:MAG: DUF3810 domain-containing protein [Lachnospiraceae bacterium]|nr:DUF3810 domain-containing protein [Lachnospiraceae bacterium]